MNETKDLKNEEELKASIHNEAFDDEAHSQKGNELENNWSLH